MNEARDLELVSIPFVIATTVSQLSGWVDGTPFIIICAASAMFAILSRHHAMALIILYSALGLFCGSCAQTCGALWSELSTLGPAAAAVDWLRGLIDNMAFEDRDSPALIKALLTGDRTDLSRETVDVFREAGASHVLALSGLHLGLIHLVIRRISALLGNSPASRLIRAISTVAAAAFYTLMTGSSPSTVRALLFISLSEWSSLSSFRRSSPRRTLLLALTIQTALSPGAVMTLSFQMSYLAMCGIIFVFPAMQAWYPQDERFQRYDPMRRIWEVTALSISCQLFTAPLAWLRFGTFPIYFILTNVLILPLTSATMMVSLLAVAASALGVCPVFLMKACELLVRSMTVSLEIICGI